MRRGLVTSRRQARDAVVSGRVTVAGAPALKPSRLVAPAEPIVVQAGGPRFVSRGGEKLHAALTRFAIDPHDHRCLDAGASTGGFTDCLLQRGAASVIAVDVGKGQLDIRLRNDPRVEVREETNIRHLTVDDIGGSVPLIVADLSFISLAVVAEPLLALLAEDGNVVALVKPQFEAGRKEASRGRGVIRDPQVWAGALHRVDGAWRHAGAAMMGVMVSPVRGARGNVEFLAHFVPAADPRPADALISAVVEDAGAG